VTTSWHPNDLFGQYTRSERRYRDDEKSGVICTSTYRAIVDIKLCPGAAYGESVGIFAVSRRLWSGVMYTYESKINCVYAFSLEDKIRQNNYERNVRWPRRRDTGNLAVI